jgi:hypothetical protein
MVWLCRASRFLSNCYRFIADCRSSAPAAAAQKRPAPRWHGYGFLPGYQQPPNNTLPAYAQRASVSRMARHNRRPWYIDPTQVITGTMATGTISAGLAFTAVATMRQLRPLLDADADRADLELRLIKPSLKDRACVYPVCRQRRLMALFGSWSGVRHRFPGNAACCRNSLVSSTDAVDHNRHRGSPDPS